MELFKDDNDNFFGLFDGLRWYLIDVEEDKLGVLNMLGFVKFIVMVVVNKVEVMVDMYIYGWFGFKFGGFVGCGVVLFGIEGVSKIFFKSFESCCFSMGFRKVLFFVIGVFWGWDSVVVSEINFFCVVLVDILVVISFI